MGADWEQGILAQSRKGRKERQRLQACVTGRLLVGFASLDMKNTLLIAVVFAGFACAFAEEIPSPKQEVAVSASNIAQIKAQEFARALVELKLQEVALSRANPIDEEKLALVHAQQAALNEELVKLAVAPLKLQLKALELQLREALNTMSPKNPSVLNEK